MELKVHKFSYAKRTNSTMRDELWIVLELPTQGK